MLTNAAQRWERFHQVAALAVVASADVESEALEIPTVEVTVARAAWAWDLALRDTLVFFIAASGEARGFHGGLSPGEGGLRLSELLVSFAAGFLLSRRCATFMYDSVFIHSCVYL